MLMMNAKFGYIRLYIKKGVIEKEIDRNREREREYKAEFVSMAPQLTYSLRCYASLLSLSLSRWDHCRLIVDTPLALSLVGC